MLRSLSARRLLATTLIASASLTIAAPSRADADTAVTSLTAPSAPPDTIYLRDGGMIRGRVQEILPTAHVTVTLSTGEVRQVPWAAVDRVIVASAATIPALPPLPAAPPPSASPVVPAAPSPASTLPMVGPRVRVHVESKKKVELHRKREVAGGTAGWVHACMSPCEVDLPIGDTYKVTGSGILSSSEFRLHEGPNHTANVVVDPTSVPGMVLGGLLGGAGGWGAYAGFLMIAVGAGRTDVDCGNGSYGGSSGAYSSMAGVERCERGRRTGPGLRDGGYVVLGTSLAAAAVGLIVLWRSASTDISQPAASPSNDAFLREPTWRKPSPVESAARPPATMFLPLVDARF